MPGRSASLQPPTGPQHLTRQTLRRAIGAGIHREVTGAVWKGPGLGSRLTHSVEVQAAQSHQPRHHCRLHARTAHTAVDGDGKSAASRLWEKIETSNLTHAEILRELEGTNKARAAASAGGIASSGNMAPDAGAALQDVLSSALGQRGERKSGSKAELVSRLAPLLTRVRLLLLCCSVCPCHPRKQLRSSDVQETEERQQGQPGTARPSEPAAEVDIISGASSKPTAKESSNLMKVSQQAAREATPSLKESDLDKAGGRDQPASVLDAESEDFDPEADSYQDDPEAGYDIADEGEGDSFDEELSSPDNAAGASAVSSRASHLTFGCLPLLSAAVCRLLRGPGPPPAITAGPEQQSCRRTIPWRVLTHP